MTDRQMAIIERALELHGMGDELIEAWQALKATVESTNSSHNMPCAHCEKRAGEHLICSDCLAALSGFEDGSP